jgi:Mg2+-importing ATPase
MTDVPEMTIAGDSVDAELVARPERWNIHFIRNFMLVFGILSSVFDYITFAVLIFILGASEDQFRTGWFLESVVSACLIVLVIRTRDIFIRSRPAKGLLAATLAIVIAVIILPFTPLAGPFNFVPPSPIFLLVMLGLVTAYILSAEAVKRLFYKTTGAPSKPLVTLK